MLIGACTLSLSHTHTLKTAHKPHKNEERWNRLTDMIPFLLYWLPWRQHLSDSLPGPLSQHTPRNKAREDIKQVLNCCHSSLYFQNLCACARVCTYTHMQANVSACIWMCVHVHAHACLHVCERAWTYLIDSGDLSSCAPWTQTEVKG